jgi:hypothetical protein
VLDLSRPWLRHTPACALLLSGLLVPVLSGFAFWPLGAWLLLLSLIAPALGLRQSGFGAHSRRVTRLVWQQTQEWQLQTAGGTVTYVRLSPRSSVSAWQMCLKFHDESGHAIQVMIWRPELPAKLWQQLQLRLRLEGCEATSQPLTGLS